MPDKAESLDAVRAKMIRLLEADDWQITESARRDGYPILHAAGIWATDCAIIEFLLDLLRSNFAFHPVELGSGETGYAMNNADGKGLYIKIKIAWDGKEEVWVLSFHKSIHCKD
jgi:hypothetical protein